MTELPEKVHLHISNGGITFQIINDDCGPTIKVSAIHFGHLTNDMAIHTDTIELARIGEMFIAASKYQNFNPDYCNKAMDFKRHYN